MSTGEFLGAIVAVIVAGTGSTIALVVYLGGRIDHLADRIDTVVSEIHQLHEDFVVHAVNREAHH